jgi:hypothetical protein
MSMFDMPENLVEIIGAEDLPQVADQTSATERAFERARAETEAVAARRRENRKKKGSTPASTRQPRDLEGLRKEAARAREQQRFDTIKGDRASQRNQMILALTQMYADGKLSREDVRSAFKASGLGRKYDPKNPNQQSFGQRMQGRARDRLAGQLKNMFGIGESETGGMGIVQMRERMREEIAAKNLREKNRIRARKGLPPLTGDEVHPRHRHLKGSSADPLADAPTAGAKPAARTADTVPDNRPAPVSPRERQGPVNLEVPDADFSGTFQDPEDIIAAIIDEPTSAATRLDPEQALRDSMNFGPVPPDPQQPQAAGVPSMLQRPAAEIFSPRDLPKPMPMTPAQRLGQRQTTREEAERGLTRLAPGAVGSAPTQPGGPATGQPTRGYAFEVQDGMHVPTEAAEQAQRYYQGETSGEPLGAPTSFLDRIRGGVQDIRQRFRSGQEAQREMMAPITGQFPMMPVKAMSGGVSASAADSRISGLKKENAALAQINTIEAEEERKRKLQQKMMERRARAKKMREEGYSSASIYMDQIMDPNAERPQDFLPIRPGPQLQPGGGLKYDNQGPIMA